MGWLFSSRWPTKKALVEHLTKENGARVVRAQVVGKVLWTVQETDLPPGRFIGCYLLERERGPRPLGWGYKDMCESMGPYEVSCPLAFLDITPPPGGESAAGWRDAVRAYHAQRTAQASAVASANVGDRVELREGCRPAILTVIGKRGRSLLGEAGGTTYRIPARYVARVLGKAA